MSILAVMSLASWAVIFHKLISIWQQRRASSRFHAAFAEAIDLLSLLQRDKDFAASPDGARRWAELIPDARLIMLAGAGHLTYVERNDRVLPALVRFFSGQWPPEAMQLRTSPRR